MVLEFFFQIIILNLFLIGIASGISISESFETLDSKPKQFFNKEGDDEVKCSLNLKRINQRIIFFTLTCYLWTIYMIFYFPRIKYSHSHYKLTDDWNFNFKYLKWNAGFEPTNASHVFSLPDHQFHLKSYLDASTLKNLSCLNNCFLFLCASTLTGTRTLRVSRPRNEQPMESSTEFMGEHRYQLKLFSNIFFLILRRFESMFVIIISRMWMKILQWNITWKKMNWVELLLITKNFKSWFDN